MNALELFRQGDDYLTIAAKLDISEAEVERIIHRLRSEEIKAKNQRRVPATRTIIEARA